MLATLLLAPSPAIASTLSSPLAAPASLRVTNAFLQVITSGQGFTRIRARVTVHNDGDQAANTAGPAPGDTLPEDYRFPDAPYGSWRIGVEFNGDTQAETGARPDHRWRWGFGAAVPAHGDGFTYGDIVLTTPGTHRYYIGLVHEYIGWTPWEDTSSYLLVTVNPSAPAAARVASEPAPNGTYSDDITVSWVIDPNGCSSYTWDQEWDRVPTNSGHFNASGGYTRFSYLGPDWSSGARDGSHTHYVKVWGCGQESLTTMGPYILHTARAPSAPASLRITNASLQVVSAGPGYTRLRARVTVHNDGDVAADTIGPAPGETFPEDYHFPESARGTWRIGVEFNGDTEAESGVRPDHRWRWGFGSSIPAHGDGFTYGDIMLSRVSTRTFYIGLVNEQIGWQPWEYDPSALAVTVREMGPAALRITSAAITVTASEAGRTTIHVQVTVHNDGGQVARTAAPGPGTRYGENDVTPDAPKNAWRVGLEYDGDAASDVTRASHPWRWGFVSDVPIDGDGVAYGEVTLTTVGTRTFYVGLVNEYVEWVTWRYGPSATPVTVSGPAQPARLRLVSASLQQVSAGGGRTQIRVRATVHNDGDVAAPTFGWDSGSVHSESEVAPTAPRDTWRIGLEFDGDTAADASRASHPWRWGFAGDVPAHGDGFAYGDLILTTPGTRVFYVGLVHEYIEWTVWRADDSALSVHVDPSRPAALRIVSAAIKQSDAGGGRTTLLVNVQVHNDGDAPARVAGPGPTEQLDENSVAPNAERDTWRVGVEFDDDPLADTSRVSHPWRWGFGRDVGAGEDGFVTGRLTLTTAGTRTFYVGLVHEQVEWVAWRYGPSATPVLVRGSRPAALRIVSATLTPLEKVAGRTTLRVEARVHNDGDQPAKMGGPAPSTALREQDTVANADRDTWRVGVDFQQDPTMTYPWRWGFGYDIPAGGDGTVSGTLVLSSAGTRTYFIGLVHEYVEWVTPVYADSRREIEVLRDPGIFSARYSAAIPPDQPANGAFTVPVNVVNASAQPWLDVGNLNLSYHWYGMNGAIVMWDGERSPLPFVVPAGGSATVLLRVRAPREPGVYMLRIDGVQEGVAWFSARGVATYDATVTVYAAESPASSAFAWPFDWANLGARFLDTVAKWEDGCARLGHMGIDLYDVDAYPSAQTETLHTEVRLAYPGKVVAVATNPSGSDVVVEHAIPQTMVDRLLRQATTLSNENRELLQQTRMIHTYYVHLDRIDVSPSDSFLPAGSVLGILGRKGVGGDGAAHLHFQVTVQKLNSLCSYNNIDPGLLLGVVDDQGSLGSITDQRGMIPVSSLPRRALAP